MFSHIVYIVSNKKYTVIFIFPLVSFKIFSFSMVLCNLIMMCLAVVFFMLMVFGVPWVFCMCGFIVFFYLWFYIFHQIWKIFLPLCVVSPFLWGLQLRVYKATESCPTALWGCVHLLNIIFYLCFIFYSSQSVSSSLPMISSAKCNLPLISLSELLSNTL